MASHQLAEIIRLQDGVIELQEGQPLLAFQPGTDAIERQSMRLIEKCGPTSRSRFDVAEAGPATSALFSISASHHPRRTARTARCSGGCPAMLAAMRSSRPAGPVPRRGRMDRRCGTYHPPSMRDQDAMTVALHQPQHHDLHQAARHAGCRPCSRTRYTRRSGPALHAASSAVQVCALVHEAADASASCRKSLVGMMVIDARNWCVGGAG